MYKVNKELLQSILDYLGTKPYIETFQLIGAMQHLEEIKEVADGSEKTSK